MREMALDDNKKLFVKGVLRGMVTVHDGEVWIPTNASPAQAFLHFYSDG